MPFRQTQLKVRVFGSQVFKRVEEEEEFWRQRSGQEAIWDVHHEDLMLRGTEAGSMVWEPTMAASTGRMAIEERMVYGFVDSVEW